jgi:hypothetical protein
MTKAEIMAMLKIDLGFKDSTYDARLEHVIDSSIAMMDREGASVDLESAECIQLIIMYAGWMWRKRFDPTPMPRMLRWALNNRIMSQKAKTDG